MLSVRNEQSKYDRLRTNGEVGCEAVEEFTPVRTEREERTDQVKTTLAGRSYLKLIKRLQLANWEIKLIYLALSNVEMSKKRVEERVLHGGHNIPNKDIERRYPRSLNNCNYSPTLIPFALSAKQSKGNPFILRLTVRSSPAQHKRQCLK